MSIAETTLSPDADGRPNTALEAKGAEFLALGHLLIEGIPSYMAYERNAGHDLVAVNVAEQRSCRIEVKSRWSATGSRKVLFRSLDLDFAVIVLLNRGNDRGQRARDDPSGKAPIDSYVVPVDVIREHIRGEGSLGSRFRIESVPLYDQFCGAWDLVRTHLGLLENVRAAP